MTSFASLTLLYESTNDNKCNCYSETLWTVSYVLSTISTGRILESLEELESCLVERREEDEELWLNSANRDKREDVIEVFRSSVGVDTYYVVMDDVDLIGQLYGSSKNNGIIKKSTSCRVAKSIVLSMSVGGGWNGIDIARLQRASRMRRSWLTGDEWCIEGMLLDLVSIDSLLLDRPEGLAEPGSSAEVARGSSGGSSTPKLNNKVGGMFSFGFTPISTQTDSLETMASYTSPNTACLEARLLHRRMHILSISDQNMDLTGHCSSTASPSAPPTLSNFDLPSPASYPHPTKINIAKKQTAIRPHRLPQPNDLTRQKRAAFLQQRRANQPLPRKSPKPFSSMRIDNIPPEITAKIQVPNTTTALFDPFATLSASHSNSSSPTSQTPSPHHLFPSTASLSNNSIPSQQHHHLLANIAINEDLTCSYKQSKLYSSSVEGVIQLQIKCPSNFDMINDYPSLILIVKDISNHIETLRENRQVATFLDNSKQTQQQTLPPKSELELSTISTTTSSEKNTSNHHNLKITIPKSDHYFPVLRYKCVSSLRPVPIRVQTRIRLKEDFVRVALQISSNPANSDDLSDLSIIMSVPSSIDGSTLITSPEGGIWNENPKPSVLWCVSEIGKGEKFHLQAQFQINNSTNNIDDSNIIKQEDLVFPVEVRCQCMYAQLSDVEFEVQPDRKEISVDNTITTKIARRFRLSHFEKS